MGDDHLSCLGTFQCSMYEGATEACRELSRNSIAQTSLTEAQMTNATADLERANLLMGDMSVKIVVQARQWFSMVQDLSVLLTRWEAKSS